MNFPPLDHYSSFTAALQGGSLPSAGIPLPDAFPDLNDYVSLLNGTSTQPSLQSENQLSAYDPALESLLLGGTEDFGTLGGDVAAAGATGYGYLFGDMDPLFDLPVGDLLSAQRGSDFTGPLSTTTINPNELLTMTTASGTRLSMSPGSGSLASASSPPPSEIPIIPHTTSSPHSVSTSSPPTSSASPSATVVAPIVAPPAANSRKRKLTPEEREEKAKERTIRNRAAAQESRDKKRKYMEDLEETNATLKSQNQQLSQRLENVETTNRTLLGRLEELASQLTTLKQQFHQTTASPSSSSSASSLPPSSAIPSSATITNTKTTPLSSTSTSETLGALSDPAAVAPISQQRTLQSSARRLPTTTTRPALFIPSDSSVSTSMYPYSGTLSGQRGPGVGVKREVEISTSTTSTSTSTGPTSTVPLAATTSTSSHPLAFIVATALLHSMVCMVSRTKLSPVSASTMGGAARSAGGGVSRRHADGVGGGSMEKSGYLEGRRMGIGLLPDLHGYVGVRRDARMSNFPFLRKIFEGNGPMAVAA